ncbi:unnamed protein product [Cylindrotheca closterium]|uniref:Uncharacterized protein n=1 Tax=Cylindrotheca closterium TaxID=2856 RepID=A0AAD2FSQ1_9STRA|nr:unnamed protein product [Cylindrotheca closterium]
MKNFKASFSRWKRFEIVKKRDVRVPEKMVAYVIGGIKNGSKSSRKNQVNTMRQVRSQTKLQKKIKRKEKIKNKRNNKTKPFSHPATTSTTMMMDSVPEVQFVGENSHKLDRQNIFRYICCILNRLNIFSNNKNDSKNHRMKVDTNTLVLLAVPVTLIASL